jgi:hypothetical protein
MEFRNALPSHQKKMFDLIVQKGLNPTDFEVLLKTAFIQHKATNFKFHVSRGPRDRSVITLSPGYGMYSHTKNFIDWDDTFQEFAMWLEFLKSELEVPDVWGQLKDIKPIVQSFNNIDDPFSETEEKITASKIEEIKSKIDKLEIPAKDIKEIKEKLDETLSLVKKLTKNQWLNYFNGTMMSYLVSKALDSGILQQIWEIIQSAFQSPGPLLP